VKIDFGSKRFLFWMMVILIFLVVGLFCLNFFGPKRFLNLDISSKPGSCLILEEKYCKGVKFVPNSNNGEEIAVFSLPAKTKLFSPSDGCLSYGGNFTLQGKIYPEVSILLSVDCNLQSAEGSYSIIGFIDKQDLKGGPIKKGAVIGFVTDNEIEPLGKNNLAFSMVRYVKDRTGKVSFENGISEIKDLFGNIH
jgi:hypothetical protein